jgi:raffinose/stachyose/melibiose transport system substrate-binding protein
MNRYVSEGAYNVSWAFNYTPNVDSWRSDLVSALAAYSAGTGDWDAVKTAFVDGWKKHYDLSKS